MDNSITERSQASQAPAATLQVPTLTLLGSLDDSQGTTALGLSTFSAKPISAIIYNPL